MGINSIKKHIPKSVKKRLIPVYRSVRKAKYDFRAKMHPSEAVYYCPCCNTRLGSFVAGNYNKRHDYFDPVRYKDTVQEVKCPQCGAIPRHRILAAWFTQHKVELKDSRILYFACERGIKLWLRRNRIKVTTADLYRKADLKLDIEETGLESESWDWVICNHVLEHVNDFRKALSEIYRILKPGGTLICSFPILSQYPTVVEETDHSESSAAKRLELYGQADHLRVFGADSAELLEKTGFEVSLMDGETMPEEILPIVGPADYDVNYLFICRKPYHR